MILEIKKYPSRRIMRPSCHTSSLKTGQMTRQTTRDQLQQCEIFRAAKIIKKKDGHKYVLAVRFMGLWAPAAALELVKLFFL